MLTLRRCPSAPGQILHRLRDAAPAAATTQAEQQFAALKARHDGGQLSDAAYDTEGRKT
jgi:hypothetical protein